MADMTPRLRRALRPMSRAARNVRRMLHRLAHDGWHPRTDYRGNRWPRSFLGCIGNALERRAARRKLGGHRYLPEHVGDKARSRSERYWRKRLGVP